MTGLAIALGLDPGSAAGVIERLRSARLTVAVAESLTGGLVSAVLTDVPGASRVVRGGLVVYATDLKTRLADVDADLLRAVGAVDPEVALQLADGARRRLSADLGLGITGVAGPDPQDGRPVGEVHLCVTSAEGRWPRSELLTGDRHTIRVQAMVAALSLLTEALEVLEGRAIGREHRDRNSR